MIWEGIQFAIGVFIGILVVVVIMALIGTIAEEYRNIRKENERRKNAQSRKRKTLSK